MPFVKRAVTPKYICRKRQNNTPYKNYLTNAGVVPVQDYELENITNKTLSNALRQLASVLLISNEIFSELNKELELINERSSRVKHRMDALSQEVEQNDPKVIPVRKYSILFK